MGGSSGSHNKPIGCGASGADAPGPDDDDDDDDDEVMGLAK
jgi:hypothetical protein